MPVSTIDSFRVAVVSPVIENDYGHIYGYWNYGVPFRVKESTALGAKQQYISIKQKINWDMDAIRPYTHNLTTSISNRTKKVIGLPIDYNVFARDIITRHLSSKRVAMSVEYLNSFKVL